MKEGIVLTTNAFRVNAIIITGFIELHSEVPVQLPIPYMAQCCRELMVIRLHVF